MKKKTHPKKQIHTVAHKQTAESSLSSRIIIIISSFSIITILVAGIVVTNKRQIMQSVQGTAIIKGMFKKAIIPLQQIPGAVSFNIYYDKEDAESALFTHAVRNIPATTQEYTIQYLRNNTTYQYQIAAADRDGKEFWFSPVTPIHNMEGM